MFITERIISLFAYAFALTIACYLMRYVINKQYKVIIFAYLIILCVFAFNYKPYITADLWRLREYISYWTNKSFKELIPYALKHTSPSWVFYSWLISRIKDINWLQTITCFWAFGNVFYIISHEIEYAGLYGRNRSLLLFYIMAVGAFYLQTISGIRSMLGLSIVSFCFYRETIEQKSVWKHVVLYLFAALVHRAVLPVVLLRFLFLAFQYKETYKRLIASLLVALLGIVAATYLWRYINSSFDYGLGYLTNRDQYSYFWEILIGIIETVETLYIMYKYRAIYKNDPTARPQNVQWAFVLIWSLISIISLPFSYSVFRRYTMFATLLSIPLLSQRLAYEAYIENGINFYKTVRYVSIIIFILSCVRGDLCGYKFFVLQ